MRIENEIKLDFNDVLIRPKRSLAPSRKAIKLDRTFEFSHTKFKLEGVPIIASNMDTIGTPTMARSLASHNMFTCLDKHVSTEQFPYDVRNNTFLTIGIKDRDELRLKYMMGNYKLNLVCVDVANGYTQYFVDYIKKIRDMYPQLIIMAGNVATPEIVHELIAVAGADICKIGTGNGSQCLTRMMTGIGYPQLSAIMECADAAHGANGRRGYICSDGGCRTVGDIAKAFGAGADFVMLGGMLAGHDECQKEWNDDQEMYFYGMASEMAMNKYNGAEEKSYKAAEGKSVLVPRRGPVEKTVNDICGGLRSACAYVGAEQLKDFSKCCTFVRVNNIHTAMTF